MAKFLCIDLLGACQDGDEAEEDQFIHLYLLSVGDLEEVMFL